MSERKFNKIVNPGDCCRQLRPRFSALNSRLAWISIAFLTFLLIIPARTYSQTSVTFAAKPIIENVQKRYKLNQKELAGITRMIKQENIEVLGIYARFGGGEPDYSEVLWQAIILRRIDFEDRIGSNLSNRQKLALRAARTAFEDRVLRLVVDDFVFSLGEFLELNSFEIEAVQDILYSEYKEKHRLIVAQLTRMPLFQKEMQVISDETDRRIRSILSPDQFREYKSLTTPDESFIAAA